MRALNLFEKAEFLMNEGCSGNLNFSVIASYRGPLNKDLVQDGIKHLQRIHPILRSCLDTSKKLSHFVATTKTVPFSEYPYQNVEQWKQVVKTDLKDRFNRESEPLWKVTLLKGENEGQILVTFHHAIADGVCAMPMMNHLFQYFSSVLNGENPTTHEFNAPLPEIITLYPLSANEPSAVQTPLPARKDLGQHTDFVKDVLDETLTANMLAWTKAQGIKVHATLYAAFLLAVKRIANPPFEELEAMTAVNFRSYFNPHVSKEHMALMRTCISDKFKIEGNEDFSVIAQAVHKSVHAKLASGEHVQNLKALEKSLSKNPTSQEMWQRAKFSDNSLVISNLGSVDFSGEYKGSKVSLNELFFVANVDPFIESASNFILGTFTYRGKTSLTLWFIEEKVKESVGQTILQEMKKILANIKCPVPATI